MQLLALQFPKKFFITSTNAVQAARSFSFIWLSKSKSLISCLICGPLKVPASIFSVLTPRNVLHKYRKHIPSPFNALTNCFIQPSFICNEERRIFSVTKRVGKFCFSRPLSSLSQSESFFVLYSLF